MHEDVTVDAPQTILTNLLADANSLDAAAFPPNGNVEKGEKVLFTIENEAIRKLYALMQMYERESLRLIVDARFEQDDSETDVDAHRAHDKAALTRMMFWFALKETYPKLWSIKETIGVRKEWALVEAKEEHPLKGLLDFLGSKGGQ